VSSALPPPTRLINAVAPIRIADHGGWTDTWFAGHGKVLNIAVEPSVEVQVAVHRAGELPDRVVLHAEDYGDRYSFTPGGVLPDRHPLLEAAVDEVGVPDDRAVLITIHSDVPSGASTGTSAAVTVALVAALDALTPGRLGPHEIAARAHRIEVERLGLQSGIQDQLCSAHGGICFVEMPLYPEASVTPVVLPDDLWWELDRRLLLVFLGRSHVSSEVHERVIARLARSGFESAELASLRTMADRARASLADGDLHALGRTMSDNTRAQADLHPDLVSPEARAVIEVARSHGALGWKVNGAGGEGGSITVLCNADMATKRALVAALAKVDPGFRPIRTRLSRHGVRVWDAPTARTG
jgi:D-glycero-alpha-D-manno-heptose-7-phosphate kinase